jgi:hypothetical protein
VRLILTLAAASALALATPLQAQEIVLGAGHSAYLDAGATDSAVLSVDLRSRPLGSLGRATVTGQLVAERHVRGDSFVGLGLAARWSLRGAWFVDAALAPGLYTAGLPGNDLGADLEFRTHIALGQALGGGRAWSLAFVHKSNAGTGRFNPGMHGVLVRWHQAF